MLEGYISQTGITSGGPYDLYTFPSSHSFKPAVAAVQFFAPPPFARALHTNHTGKFISLLILETFCIEHTLHNLKISFESWQTAQTLEHSQSETG